MKKFLIGLGLGVLSVLGGHYVEAYHPDPLAVIYGGTGVTTKTGTGSVVLSTSPTLVTPALGTPSALVGTNISGTASGLTAGNVTTNANLTGVITSVGNATSTGAQTGTGNTFVMSVSPSLTTPALGTPSALVGTNITGTATGFTVGAATNLVGGTAGSTPYQSGVGTTSFLAPGTSGFFLTSGGTGAPTWSAGLSNPMTTLGDFIYGGAAGLATRLAGNTTTTLEILTQTGTGSASQAPALTALSAIPGGLTSNGTSDWRVETAQVAPSSNVACTVALQSSTWISSTTPNGTGDCTLNFAGSTFSSQPICTLAMTRNTSQETADILSGSLTNTSVRIIARNAADSAGAGDYFFIICMGPR